MAGKRYDSHELLMMAAMRDRGLSIPTIAKELGRTPSGIQSALRARGQTDPVRSKLMSSVCIFSLEQKVAFREFVCTRGAACTPSDIREEWNREAAARGWPTVNNERVIYYLRGARLQKTKREYMQYESYRRRQSMAQRTRRAQEREARRRFLRTRRQELYEREPTIGRRKCQVCLETWPLTIEFFRHAGSSEEYFLTACKICYCSLNGTADERRRQRMHAYDRHVIVKQISVAKADRDVFLRQHRNFPTRRCSRCHEIWELRSARFPIYHTTGGGDLYRRTCRFCLRAAARLNQREETAFDRIPAVVARESPTPDGRLGSALAVSWRSPVGHRSGAGARSSPVPRRHSNMDRRATSNIDKTYGRPSEGVTV
jgi:hypothetical protein